MMDVEITIHADSENQELIALLKAIQMLDAEEASPEIYRDLEILVHACMWSAESYAVVKDTAKTIKTRHITENGRWK